MANKEEPQEGKMGYTDGYCSVFVACGLETKSLGLWTLIYLDG